MALLLLTDQKHDGKTGRDEQQQQEVRHQSTKNGLRCAVPKASGQQPAALLPIKLVVAVMCEGLGKTEVRLDKIGTPRFDLSTRLPEPLAAKEKGSVLL